MSLTTMTAPPPAPGEEHHPALALVNTCFHSAGRPVDVIATAEQATRWLAEHGRRTRLDRLATVALQELRDAVRTLFEARLKGAPPPVAAIDMVNAVLRQAPSVHRLHWSHRQPPRAERVAIAGGPVDRALTEIAADAVDLLTTDGVLAACGAPGCIRFLARTHGKQQWCSTRCGNRVRAARHYTRSHPRAAATYHAAAR